MEQERIIAQQEIVFSSISHNKGTSFGLSIGACTDDQENYVFDCGDGLHMYSFFMTRNTYSNDKSR